MSDIPHRRNRAKAHGDRNTQARHLRRTVSGSNPDIGGTELTEAPVSNRNTFNGKTNGNVKGQKVIRGAWTTCDNLFSNIYILICTAVQRNFRPSSVFTRSHILSQSGERETEKRKYAYRSVDSKSRERERENRINYTRRRRQRSGRGSIVP